MKYRYKLLIILFLGVTSLNIWAQEQSKQLLNKSYKVDNKTLSVNNSFGNITVSTWDKQEYVVVANLKTDGFSDKEFAKLLEKVKIIEKEESDMISLKTDWDNYNQSSSGKKSFEVNYEIKTPKNAPLDLDNSFGNISIPDFKGKLKIKEEYGQLSAGELAEADIKISFSGGSISGLEKGTLKIMYADKIAIGTLGDVILESGYSHLDIATAKTIELKQKYGDLKIGKLYSLEGSSAFSGLEIDELSGRFILKAQYVSGKLNIKNITPAFEVIDIDSKFSKVNLDFDSRCNFTFTSEHKFGGLNYDKSIIIDKKDKGDYSAEYEGHKGNNNGNSKVKVSTSYGDVSMDVN